mmetsp:Transcript_4044/g.7792  ORF Transcript_4044/g.7792 Transcript_4044/m.7792 type:complete len:235 (+) Transcript_4044:752-1456(+)
MDRNTGSMEETVMRTRVELIASGKVRCGSWTLLAKLPKSSHPLNCHRARASISDHCSFPSFATQPLGSAYGKAKPHSRTTGTRITTLKTAAAHPAASKPIQLTTVATTMTVIATPTCSAELCHPAALQMYCDTSIGYRQLSQKLVTMYCTATTLPATGPKAAQAQSTIPPTESGYAEASSEVIRTIGQHHRNGMAESVISIIIGEDDWTPSSMPYGPALTHMYTHTAICIQLIE